MIPWIRIGEYDWMLPPKGDLGWSGEEEIKRGATIGRHAGCGMTRDRRMTFELNTGPVQHGVICCSHDCCFFRLVLLLTATNRLQTIADLEQACESLFPRDHLSAHINGWLARQRCEREEFAYT